MVDVVVEGLELKEPVYVDVLTGTVHDLKPILKGVRGGGAMEFKGLPLWDCPVVIMEKSEVNFK